MESVTGPFYPIPLILGEEVLISITVITVMNSMINSSITVLITISLIIISAIKVQGMGYIYEFRES